MYQLKLTTTESSSPTPGTIYLFSNNESFPLPNIYISTNCSTAMACPAENFTSVPTANKNCWNANSGNVLMW